MVGKPNRLFVIVASLGCLCLAHPVGAEDKIADSEPSETSWTIAVHGGAGGDPAKWSDDAKQRRLQGITEAIRIGSKSLAEGRRGIEVVEQVVRLMEDNPVFNAGRGAVLNAEGKAELDASIMDGRTLQCGAVGSVTTVKNPISLARLVMLETRHVLLVGVGAERFAREQGVEIVEPGYFDLDDNTNKVSVYRYAQGTPRGTVGCVVMDRYGDLAAATSTGGLKGKRVGRIGDSPLIGAGTYANNETCAVSGTGVGEEFIRHAVAYDIAARMKYQRKTLKEAVKTVIDQTLAKDVGGVIAVDSQGEIVMNHNTPGMTCGAASAQGRFEVLLSVPNP